MSNYSSKINLSKLSWKSIIGFIAALVVGLLVGGTVGVNISNTDEGVIIEATGNSVIELSDEQVPTVIETEDGEVEVLNAPTVEMVDGNGLVDECPEGEECGKGAFRYVDVTSPTAIKDSILGTCVDVDGYFGSQCWDASAAVAENMTGRRLSTCGTGAAKGMMDCWQSNAGEDYDVIWEATAVQPGDIAVFGGGAYGHTGIVLGYYNNGYVALLGTNQGGTGCAGGGSSANIINISLKNFIGAYRWKEYVVKEEPKPEVKRNCSEWKVEKGDTLGAIMAYCEGETDWANMAGYAESWVSTQTKPGQTVYAGWISEGGVGLYAGDVIRFTGEQ